ncbi:hypothetical protein PMAYCL1PPCAC_03361 [Pristionchus mayeri]|uniref:Uncharacterized protein n=1 Tax=Pristionchus mayeri TaxID=1317129 RepID=A0AAN4Z3C4_9BILA|nr:hypothetical protein PMAYCL1PPCAC_03361 [Pristionchus mayeri]
MPLNDDEPCVPRIRVGEKLAVLTLNLDTVYTFPTHPLSSTAHKNITALLIQADALLDGINGRIGVQEHEILDMERGALVISEWAIAFFLTLDVNPNETSALFSFQAVMVFNLKLKGALATSVVARRKLRQSRSLDSFLFTGFVRFHSDS